jgi:hypothetical protein
MKKLLLLAPVFMFLAASCSTDSDSFYDEDITRQSAAREALPSTTLTINTSSVCFPELTVQVSNTGTLSNPVIRFTPNSPKSTGAATSYRLYIELQATDCEDITNGYGDIITYQNPTPFYNLKNNLPYIELLPTQTLPCYRWRVYIQGSNFSGRVSCTSYSEWYDAPIL